MTDDKKKPEVEKSAPSGTVAELLLAQFVDEHNREFSTHVEGCTCWTCPWVRKFKAAIK